MNSKRTLVQKPPSQWKQLVDAMPLLLFLFGIALIVICIVVVGCMFQAPVTLGHEVGTI